MSDGETGEVTDPGNINRAVGEWDRDGKAANEGNPHYGELVTGA